MKIGFSWSFGLIWKSVNNFILKYWRAYVKNEAYKIFSGISQDSAFILVNIVGMFKEKLISSVLYRIKNSFNKGFFEYSVKLWSNTLM